LRDTTATKKTTADSLGYADAVTELEEILSELEADDVDVDRLAEQVRRVIGIAKLIRGGLVDRHRSGAGGRIGLAADVDLLGFETPGVAHEPRHYPAIPDLPSRD